MMREKVFNSGETFKSNKFHQLSKLHVVHFMIFCLMFQDQEEPRDIAPFDSEVDFEAPYMAPVDSKTQDMAVVVSETPDMAPVNFKPPGTVPVDSEAPDMAPVDSEAEIYCTDSNSIKGRVGGAGGLL